MNRPYAPTQTVKCEWCGARVQEATAYEYAGAIRLHLCFCSEACLAHAPSLAEAIYIAAAPFSQYLYKGPRGKKGQQ